MATPKKSEKGILDWKELEQAPNVRGLYSFLSPAAQVVSIRRGRETQPGDENHPGKSLRHPRKVYECKLVQHGHSQGEQLLYDELWKLGSGDSQEHRDVTIALDLMGDGGLNMSGKAAKRNIASLIEKLAVEIVKEYDSSRRIARTYRVFSFKTILNRRKAAGLLHVVRDRGVHFVTPDGHPLSVGQPNRIELKRQAARDSSFSGVDEISSVRGDETSPLTGDKTSPLRGDETSIARVDKTSPPLSKYLGNSLSNMSSTNEDVEQVLDALSAYATADRDAAELMMRSCRSTCPDVQGGEVAVLIHEKAAIMKARRDVSNPVGFLLSAVPRCCEPRTLAELRRRAQAAAEMERERLVTAGERDREQIAYFRRLYCESIAQLEHPNLPQLQAERLHRDIATMEHWFLDVGVSAVE